MHVVQATVDDQVMTLVPKNFKTGSTGWHGQGKIAIQGQRCQVSITCVIIGSKGDNAAAVGAQSLQREAEQVDKTSRKPRKAPGKPKAASEAENGDLPGQRFLPGM